MKKTAILTILMFGVCILSAQNIEIATVSAGGQCLKSTSVVLQFSIGQPFAAYHEGQEVNIQEGIFYNHSDITSSTSELEIAILELSVFPNPSSDYIILDDAYDHKSGTLRIYNSNGTVVRSTQYDSGSRYDISALNTGPYIIELEAEGTRKVAQFIKS